MDMLRRTIIIDDDPTGCQTVRDVPVLLEWDEKSLEEALDGDTAVFVQTNTRAMDPARASAVSKEVCLNLNAVCRRRGYLPTIISRSDSMLRGYVKEELTPIIETFREISGIVLAPAFFECGRVTEGDCHYLIADGRKIPVSETEFASDPVFGYDSSYLPAWLETRSSGYFRKDDCISVTSQNARQAFTSGRRGSIYIINASSYAELDFICDCIRSVEESGKRFVFRSAASLVRSYLGQKEDSSYCPAGGCAHVLTVAGSYTALTSGQIEELLRAGDITPVQVDVHELVSDPSCIRETAGKVEDALRTGSCLLYTSRDFVPASQDEGQSSLGARIARSICGICARLNLKPDAIIAKGGITSLTLARDAFGIRQARVLGQIVPGVSVWRRKDDDSDFVVFPGNVGKKTDLRTVFEKYIY